MTFRIWSWAGTKTVVLWFDNFMLGVHHNKTSYKNENLCRVIWMCRFERRVLDVQHKTLLPVSSWGSADRPQSWWKMAAHWGSAHPWSKMEAYAEQTNKKSTRIDSGLNTTTPCLGMKLLSRAKLSILEVRHSERCVWFGQSLRLHRRGFSLNNSQPRWLPG